MNKKQMIRNFALVTYIDGVESLVRNVKLKIGVASVIKSLSQTSKTISEDFSVNFWLSMCF